MDDLRRLQRCALLEVFGFASDGVVAPFPLLLFDVLMQLTFALCRLCLDRPPLREFQLSSLCLSVMEEQVSCLFAGIERNSIVIEFPFLPCLLEIITLACKHGRGTLPLL